MGRLEAWAAVEGCGMRVRGVVAHFLPFSRSSNEVPRICLRLL